MPTVGIYSQEIREAVLTHFALETTVMIALQTKLHFPLSRLLPVKSVSGGKENRKLIMINLHISLTDQQYLMNIAAALVTEHTNNGVKQSLLDRLILSISNMLKMVALRTESTDTALTTLPFL